MNCWVDLLRCSPEEKEAIKKEIDDPEKSLWNRIQL